MRLRWGLIGALVLAAASQGLAGTVHIRPRSWVWTADETKQIDKLQQQVVRNAKGYYCIDAGRFNIRTDVSRRFAAEVSVFMDLFYDGMCGFLFDTLQVAPPAAPKRKAVFVVPAGSASSSAKKRGGAAPAAGPIYFPRKPTVVIYSTQQQYRSVFADRSGGKFTCSWDRRGRCTRFHIYCYMPDRRRRTFRQFNHSTLMHESTHCLLHALAGKAHIPLWFDEGCAGLVESWDLRTLAKGQVKLRYSRWQNTQALKRPADGYYMHGPSLTKLLAVKRWNTDKMGPQTRYRYAIAWNFMEFLFTTDQGRPALRTMFGKLIRQEKTLLPERESWALEPQWHRFLKKTMK